MSKQNAQPKPRKLSKEEKVEQARLRSLVQDIIYPILLKHSKSIKDAKTICKTLTVGMDALFMQKIKEYQTELSKDMLDVLKLEENMNDPKQYQAEHKLAEALRNEPISVAKDLIEGMHGELNRLTDKELLDRPLKSLKTEWL